MWLLLKAVRSNLSNKPLWVVVISYLAFFNTSNGSRKSGETFIRLSNEGIFILMVYIVVQWSRYNSKFFPDFSFCCVCELD